MIIGHIKAKIRKSCWSLSKKTSSRARKRREKANLEFSCEGTQENSLTLAFLGFFF